MNQIKLTELEPHWGGTEQDGRYALNFVCPVAGCPNSVHGGHYISVPFKIFRGYDPKTQHIWMKTGETFEDITLTPSVDATQNKQGKKTGCLFHGFITNGEVKW
jgi:Family of unknown function (DUF6527)